MTYQKALDGFKRLHGDIDKNDHLFVGTINPDFVQMAISALEKQIPKKPTKNGGLEEDIKIGNAIFKKETSVLPKCPDCGGWLRPMQKYCSDCGKAIDWSDEE